MVHLTSGHIDSRLRVRPFVLSVDAGQVLERRGWALGQHRVLSELESPEILVSFSRTLKSGRPIGGLLEIVPFGAKAIAVVSKVDSDTYGNGIAYFEDRLYPLARQPFIASLDLVRFIERIAERGAKQFASVRAVGFDRASHARRDDRKRQSVVSAFEEMLDQDRDAHSFDVEFRGTRLGDITVRIDRNLRFSFEHHVSVVQAREFALNDAVELALQTASRRSVAVTDFHEQQGLCLTFKQNTLTDVRQLRYLCERLSQMDGIMVSIGHLNPYLDARITDVLSGDILQLVAMGDDSISVVPLVARKGTGVERSVGAIRRFFGEPLSEELVSVSGQ